jgi:RNA polymerase sigma-70 factor (ECF subfamily)
VRVLTNEEQLRAMMVDGLDGDAAAHAALLGALVPILRSFYRRRIRDGDEDIEDLVQETLIAVHVRRGTYDRDQAFTAWLFAIARYKMIDHFRRRRRLRTIDGVEELLVAEDFEEASSARVDVRRLLDGLPAKQAKAIRETKIDDLSVAEAAKSARIGESDVKVSVHRGLKALAARIRGEGR